MHTISINTLKKQPRKGVFHRTAFLQQYFRAAARVWLILASVAWFLTACNQAPEPGTAAQQPAAPEGPRVPVPEFSADSAYHFVGAQCAFGPRVPNTPAHAKCAEWLTASLKRFTPHVSVQKGTTYAYDKTPLRFSNIIAGFNPEAAGRILLCAHWDSRPFADHDHDPANRRKPVMGANDGASGVGVLLEVARQLSLKPPPVGVDIILFDVEDYGPHQEEATGNNEEHWGLGSQHWAKNPHKPGYTARYGILLDMVGAANATFLPEGFSMDYAADIVKLVWSAGNRAGFSSYFLYEQGGYITDDHVPINRIRKIPTVDVIHLDRNTTSGFYPYWHTTGDTFDKIDRNTLKAVGQTVLTVIYEER